MSKKADFEGWVTKYNIPCTDGRTIMNGAFKHQNHAKVPLIWNHKHDGPENILGTMILEHRDGGMWGYGFFNESEKAKNAKIAVNHGDINSMSIHANRLKQNGSDVYHGMIKEVSLVIAGANRGATIETVLQHGEEGYEDAIVCYNEPLMHSDYILEEEPMGINHADDETDAGASETSTKEKTIEDVINGMSDEKKAVLAILIKASEGNVDIPEDEEENDDSVAEHADEGKGKTVREIFDTFTEEEKNVAYYLIGEAAKNMSHSEGGNDDMKKNLFENGDVMENEDDVLTHAEEVEIIKGIKKHGSLKESFLSHGIEEIDTLYPEAHNVTTEPTLITRDMSWVDVVLNGVTKSPFSRIKSIFANLTEDEARAKGYIKGNYKKEQIFPLLKRKTQPTTIYKKQKLDKDDLDDIVDFNVVAMIKKEMQFMLNEEEARAILVGDGRDDGTDDKIDETCIRPIWKDSRDLFVVGRVLTFANNITEDEKAKVIERTIVKARKDYKGSGNLIMFTSEDNLTDMLLREDNDGRRLYTDEAMLARALRVSKIVTVPIFENLTRIVNGETLKLEAICVNLKDYTTGSRNGGKVSMFSDFDIDYNQEKYLIETRKSGALTVPFSAIVIESKIANA